MEGWAAANDDAQLIRLSYYPFLPEVRDVVKARAPPIDQALGSPLQEPARNRAVQRIEGALGSGIRPAQVLDGGDAVQELLSFALARMLCVHLAERQLVARLASAEARLVAQALTRDTEPDSVVEVAAALGLPVQAVPGGPNGPAYRLHFSTYILNAPLSEAEWKLIRRQVAAGWMELPQPDLARLCQEAFARRITHELEAELERPMPPDLVALLAPIAARVAPKLEDAKAEWTTGDFGPVQPGLFPPCVKELFAAMQRRENIPHHGRFAFATFLGTVGWNANQIMDYMTAIPNFDREKSRYQIEHVTGERGVEKYTPPSCATMQTHGVCPLDKRDGLCAKVKHPLSYYRARLRFAAQDEARANAVKPKETPVSPAAAPATTAVNHG